MEDVSQAGVRVSPSRFRKLKQTIGKCDREIQKCDSEIDFLGKVVLIWSVAGPNYNRVMTTMKRLRKKREQLDSKRKKARLEIKGYNV